MSNPNNSKTALLETLGKTVNRSPQVSATLDALQQLIDVVAQLRSPDGGCPWDLAQTQQTLTPCVIELSGAENFS